MFSKEEDKMVNLSFNFINEGFDEGVSKALNFLTEIGIGYLSERNGPKAEKIVFSIKDIGKAAALQTIVSYAGSRYLNNASIEAKVALESFNEPDLINYEAKIKKIEAIRESMKALWVDSK